MSSQPLIPVRLSPHEGAGTRIILMLSITFALTFEGASPAQAHFERHRGLGASLISDIDGDGYDDVLASDQHAPFQEMGRLKVYSGATGAEILGYLVPGDFECFGHHIGDAGDFDGDGFAEVWVSSESSYWWLQPHSVRVFSPLTGAAWANLPSDASSTRCFGWDVAWLGDIDGDGVSDAAVSDPERSYPDLAGWVGIYSGASGTLLYSLAGAVNDRLGTAVEAIDDADGDGIRDFAVSAPTIPPNLSGTLGYVRICSGSNGSTITTLTGTFAGEDFGASLDASSDFDGDGVRDLIVGSPRMTPFPFAGPRGVVEIYSGATFSPIGRIEGQVPYSEFGSKVLSRDFNLDGVPDLAITSAFPPPGRFQVFDGTTFTEFAANSLEPSRPAPTLLSAGDVSGDGKPDLLLYSPPFADVFSIGDSRPALPPIADGSHSIRFGAPPFLTVSGKSGGPRHYVHVPRSSQFDISLDNQRYAGISEFILLGFIGVPGEADVTPLGYLNGLSVGCIKTMMMPHCSQRSGDPRLFTFAASSAPGSCTLLPEPMTGPFLVDSPGVSISIRLTLQALLKWTSPSGDLYATSNAIILDII